MFLAAYARVPYSRMQSAVSQAVRELAEAELLSLLSAGKQPHRIGDQVEQELGRPGQGGRRKLVGVGSECVR
jgi:hypothetical protein